MKLAITRDAFGASSPIGEVVRPHTMVLLALALFGCSSSDSQVTHPSVVGMTDTTPAYYSDGNTTLYEVQVPVTIPMRMPDAKEAKTLGAPAAFLAAFGAPTAPWIRVDDVQITVRFTITNLDDQAHSIEFLVDPWNPYVKYKPGIQIVSDEETLPDLSGFDRYYVLDKKERIQGTLVPDDTRELAVDLATVMNIQAIDPTDPDGNGLFNHTFNLQNRSSDNDLLIQKFIPGAQDIPSLIGFDLGLRSLDPMNIAVEVSVDVQDISGKKVMPADGTTNADNVAFMPPGATLSPPKAAPMM